MDFFVFNFKWIMLLSGVLTITLFYAFISPKAALKSNFGESLEGPVANILVRNWGALVGLIGAMLIYGAFEPSVRNFSLIIAGISKIVFIFLVITSAKSFRKFGAGKAVIADSIMVVLYTAYLIISCMS